MLCAFQSRGGFCGEKGFLQNRVNLYAVPPKGGFLLYLQTDILCEPAQPVRLYGLLPVHSCRRTGGLFPKTEPRQMEQRCIFGFHG